MKANLLTSLQKIDPEVDKKKLNNLLNVVFTFDEEKKQRLFAYYQRCGRVFDPGELHNTFAINRVMGEFDRHECLTLEEKKEILALLHIANGFSPKSISNYKTNPVSRDEFDLFKRDNSDLRERNRKFLYGVGLLLHFDFDRINRLLILLHPEGGIHYRDHCELIFSSFIGHRELFPQDWNDLDCFRELVWLTYSLQPDTWQSLQKDEEKKLSAFKMKKTISNIQENLTCHGPSELWTHQIREEFYHLSFDSIESFKEKFLWYSHRYGFYHQTSRNRCIQDLIDLTDHTDNFPVAIVQAAVDYGIKKGIFTEDEGEIYFQDDVNVNFGRFDLIYLFLLKKEWQKTKPCEIQMDFGKLDCPPTASPNLLPDIAFCIRKMNEAAGNQNWAMVEAMVQRGIEDCEDIFFLDEKIFCLAHFYGCQAELALIGGHEEDFTKKMMKAMACLMKSDDPALLPALETLGCAFLRHMKTGKWNRQITLCFYQLFQYFCEHGRCYHGLFYQTGKALSENGVLSPEEKAEVLTWMEKEKGNYLEHVFSEIQNLMKETGYAAEFPSDAYGIYALPMTMLKEQQPGYFDDLAALFLKNLEDCRNMSDNRKGKMDDN